MFADNLCMPAEGTILNKIVKNKVKELIERQELMPLKALYRGISTSPETLDFKKAIKKSGDSKVSIIAEIKKASPSGGAIDSPLLSSKGVAVMASIYENAGASAISVLTDSKYFGGTIDDLLEVSEGVAIPVLRKDFIIDEYQIYEARLMGASAVLLITSILTDRGLTDLLKLSHQLGMDALVETGTKEEVERAVEVGADIIGINNRDLKTMTIKLNRTIELASLIPENKIIISESGINSRTDVEKLQKDAGIDAVLVGTGIVSAPDPAIKIAELLGRL